MRIDLYVHFEQSEAPPWANELLAIVSQIQTVQETIMPTLADLQAQAAATLAQVTADTNLDNAVATVVTNQNTLIASLQAQLAAAGTDPVALQQLSDTMTAILATDTSNAAVVSAAVKAGTPTPPVTPPSS